MHIWSTYTSQSAAKAQVIHQSRLHNSSFQNHISRAQKPAKRQRRHLLLTKSQNDEDLEKAIQEGLDEQDLRVQALKLQAQGFKDSNDRLEELADTVREELAGTSIYLVGMMGSGKSTVGKLIADALEYPLIDSDEIAEESQDCSIADIFESEGEEAFRDIESEILQEIMPFKACVISTGGGVVERRKNWGYMQHGIVIWLDGPAEILARRACKDGQGSRPLLGKSQQDASEEEQLHATTAKLAEILDRRRGQYAQADIRIPLEDDDNNESGASLAEVASRLLEALNERMQSDKGSKGKKPPGKEFKGFGPPH